MLNTSAEQETLFENGRFLTANGSRRVESVLVRGGRIVALGDASDVDTLVSARTERVDLGGRHALPGFVDAHCHPLMYGQFLGWVDCSWEAVPDIEAVVAALRARESAMPAGAVRGRGFHHGNVRDRRMLNRLDLDRVSTEREVMVFHSSGHGAIVNSWMLASLGVDASTPDPPGGHFGRFEDGTPNGEVWDAAADWITGQYGVKITNHGPNFHVEDSPELLAEHLSLAQSVLHRSGVTTVVDAQVTKRELSTYLRLRADGRMTLRVEMLMISSLLEHLEQLGISGRLGDDLLAIAGIKIYIDGALTAGTARFSEHYCCDPSDYGYLYHSPEEILDLLRRADQLGIQTGTHAQGDAAIQLLLDAHEQVRAASQRSDARHRIEHFGGPTSEQIFRTRELGLWPITQPQYLYRYGGELRRALGDDRASRICPLGAMRDAGVPLVLSSDAPVCPPYPLEAIAAAVTRNTLDGSRLGSPEEGLTLREAYDAHTIGAAASVHRETDVGSLEPGKFADFVLFERDPLGTAPEELTHLQVDQTFVSGNCVFDRTAEGPRR